VMMVGDIGETDSRVFFLDWILFSGNYSCTLVLSFSLVL